MAEISLPSHLLQKLEEIAKNEKRTPVEVLETLLHEHSMRVGAPSQIDTPPIGTLARLAYEAGKLGFHSGQTDTAERSREILQDEFADYLIRKMADGE